MDIKVGDKGYLRRFTGNSWVDEVKRPVTVIEATPSYVVVQHCKLIAPIYHCTDKFHGRPDLEGQRVFFYDTVAESIEPDPNGMTTKLTWHSRRKLYGSENVRDRDYPEYLIVGEYKHQPYLN